MWVDGGAQSNLRPSARLYALEIGFLFAFAELDKTRTFFELNAARIETVCVGSDGGLCRMHQGE
jgi:hypothetical protein